MNQVVNCNLERLTLYAWCVCENNEFNFSCVVFEVPKAMEGGSLSQEGKISQENNYLALLTNCLA